MKNIQRRHDLSDEAWALLEPHLSGQSGQWGGIAKDNRLFINAVFWILRTGAPWRDLPPEYGRWGTVHQRFIRWRDKRIWESLLEILIDEPDFEWLMIDASHCKVHPHAAGARGGNQGMERTKRGLNSKIHLAVDAHGMPVRVIVTAGTTADCTQATALINGIAAQFLLADRGYDTNELIGKALESGCEVVIPPKKNRKEQRSYDKYVYRVRHLVENAFLHLKRWRGIATRYAKTLAAFAAAVQIRCIALWLKLLS
ncbi:IS5 family transposase [Desulfovibrio sp. MES5]|uniref:IS5 family transposase n=1 Tax=Desulfovibrio sp. MES5 TaxID=1899016 RepID=UPI0025C3EBEE|nr:IS5 family transposase [Desulfovibrio sp. MES5]